ERRIAANEYEFLYQQSLVDQVDHLRKGEFAALGGRDFERTGRLIVADDRELGLIGEPFKDAGPGHGAKFEGNGLLRSLALGILGGRRFARFLFLGGR